MVQVQLQQHRGNLHPDQVPREAEAVKPVETFYAAGSPRSGMVCSSSGRGGLMWTTSGNEGGTGTEWNQCGFAT